MSYANHFPVKLADPTKSKIYPSFWLVKFQPCTNGTICNGENLRHRGKNNPVPEIKINSARLRLAGGTLFLSHSRARCQCYSIAMLEPACKRPWLFNERGRNLPPSYNRGGTSANGYTDVRLHCRQGFFLFRVKFPLSQRTDDRYCYDWVDFPSPRHPRQSLVSSLACSLASRITSTPTVTSR